MGYHLNGLDEPVFLAVSKPLLTEFGIHHELESCVTIYSVLCGQASQQSNSGHVLHLYTLSLFSVISCHVSASSFVVQGVRLPVNEILLLLCKNYNIYNYQLEPKACYENPITY